MATFEEVYRRHAQTVFRCALGLVGRKELAEDLTSEAFLALLRNFDRVDHDQLPAWLLSVVRNRARDWWRREQVQLRHERATSSAEEPAASPPLELWILDCADLKPVHRACLILRYVREFTRAEIADRLGLTETQVKGHLQYGLTLLRKTYGKTEVA
jgi:RNA polymerase sigma-70 factor (ECF subfamily)